MKLERILTSIALVLISGLVAVSTSFAQTVSYKGSPMRSGEIVVVQRGDVALQQKANIALDAVRADFSPSLGRQVNAETSVWGVAQGDMDAVLARLNAIEGVTAFPNYVYKREEMTPTLVDEQLLARGASVPVDRPLRPMASFPSQRRAAPSQPVSPNIQRPKSNVDRMAFDLGDVTTGGDTLFTEDFNDSQQVEARWTFWEARGPMGWGLIKPYQDTTDAAMGIGDFENGYDNDVWSSADVYLNTSGLDGRLAYDISFNFAFETEEDWDYFRFVIWDPVAERVIHMSSFTGSSDGLQTHSRSISGIGHVDEVVMAFQFESDSDIVGGFGAFIDDIVITSRASDTPTDFFFSAQWSFENDGTFSESAVVDADIDMLSAWTVTEGTDDVVVVIMDDGVDFGHPDLAPSAWVNPGEDLNSDGVITADEENGIDDDGNGYVDDFHGWYTNYDTNEYLTSGSFHGTHVAGTVGAASYNGIGVAGVAPGVKLASVMFFDEVGNADAASIIGAYSYITALLEQGVNVVAINQSWGGGDYYYGDPNQSLMVAEMTKHALDHAEWGAIWVVSAGNSSLDRDNVYFYSYPNNIPSPNIITVASTDDADELSGFSDFGMRTVDIGAPGSDIISTYPGGYAYLSGTSMAAPHVSGVVALAASAFPDEPMEGRLARILATGDVKGNFQGVFGEGERLNAAMALDAEGTLQGLVPSHGSALTQYTVDDIEGATAIGFVNASGGSLEITGWSVAQAGSSFVLPPQPQSPINFGDGEAFGLPVFYLGTSTEAEEATVTISTTQGDVLIGVDAIKLGYGEMFISEDYVDKGTVSDNEVVSSSFELSVVGTAGLDYTLVPFLYYEEPSLSSAVQRTGRGIYNPGHTEAKVAPPVTRPTGYYEGGLLARPGLEPIAVQYEDTTFAVFEDNFESYSTLDDLTQVWYLGTFTGFDPSRTWQLLTLADGDASINQVVATALPGDTYSPYTGTYLVMPPLDFSNVTVDGVEQIPALFEFDYASALEDGYDYFFVDVYVNGYFEDTIIMSGDGLINDGQGYTAMTDLTWLAGAPYVEFVFGFVSDEFYEPGFGFLFDNVSVSVKPNPITYSATTGFVSLDSPVQVDVSYDTGFGLGGPVSLFTQVYSNGIAGSDWLLHQMDMFVPSDDIVALEIPYVTIMEDEVDIDVPILLASSVPANLSIYSFDMAIYYDPYVIGITVPDQVPVEVANGSDWQVLANEVYPGEILIAAAGSTPLSQPGQLLNLKIEGIEAGFSPIYVDGYINANEKYFSVLPGGGIEVVVGGMMGDVDMNQVVQAYDASMVLQHVVGYEPAMNEYLADVDGSETIDATDASYILQYVVKLIDCMPMECQQGKGAEVWGSAALSYGAPIVTGEEVRIPVALEQLQGAVGALTLDITGLGDHVSFLGLEDIPTTWMKAHRVAGDGMRLAIASGMSMAPGDGFTLVFKVAEGRSEELSFEAQVNNGPVQAASIALGELPGQLALHAVYPNPFASQATVRFDLPDVSEVTVRVIDVLGREVARIADGVYEAGIHQMPIQLGGLSSGTYLVLLETPTSATVTRRVVKL